MNTLGQRLKDIRKDMSQKDVSTKLGIPQQTWANYELNKSNPNFLLIDAICSLFKVNTDWLLFGRGPMRPGEEAPAAQAPSSTPQETGSIAAQGARVALLEEVLKAKEEALRAKEELLKAKDETLAAYKQALDTMRELALMGGPTTTGAPPCAPPAPSPNHASK